MTADNSTKKQALLYENSLELDLINLKEHQRQTDPQSPPLEEKAKKNDEKVLKKILTRLQYGMMMFGLFLLILYSGHVYICFFVSLLHILTFRELVRVRYNTYFTIIHEQIPLFRTTQWMWFALATFYTYSGFITDIIKNNPDLHHLSKYAQYRQTTSFIFYSLTFILTIATLQKEHIRFQLNQLCWTILVNCLIIGQSMYIMHNVYNGLVWFTVPILLVISNDCFAYLAGISIGRKFIKKTPFFALSPKKTWEGFICGGIGTVLYGWILSFYISKYAWMTCPTNQFTFFPDALECELDPIFHEAYVDFFSFKKVKVIPFQIHTFVLSLFASFVAPFGGFLASAIKRAYNVKDFDSIIPGHGGIMDRVDCQFLMALYTWVHYNSFVRSHTVSVPKLIYMFNLLNDDEQRMFLQRILENTTQS